MIVAVILITALLCMSRFRGQNNPARKIIFIGDSRTVAMYWAVTDDYGSEDICKTGSDGNLWSCKSGAGLAWMEETGVPQIEDEIQAGDIVVSMMGVNDIAAGQVTADDYLSYLNERAQSWMKKGANVFYVSVNPVRTALSNGLTNEMIDSWNKKIQDGITAGVGYIDTNTEIRDHVDYADDLHYENDTSREIYDLILYCISAGADTEYNL